MASRGQHRARAHRALIAARRRTCSRHRIRRGVPTPGRPRHRAPPKTRGSAARMRFRRRRSLLPRIRSRPNQEEAAPLKGQLWTRSERNLKEPDVHPMRRVVAAAVAVAEGALLGWLWFGPALAVTSVDISGAHHLTAAPVAAAVGLSGNGSVLAVDGESDRHHLLAQVWVRTATVDPQLDGTVVLRISEWQPIAAYHAGGRN